MKKAIARIKGRQCVEVEVNDNVKLGDPVSVRLSSASEEVKLFPVIAFTGVSDVPSEPVALAPAPASAVPAAPRSWRRKLLSFCWKLFKACAITIGVTILLIGIMVAITALVLRLQG